MLILEYDNVPEDKLYVFFCSLSLQTLHYHICNDIWALHNFELKLFLHPSILVSGEEVVRLAHVSNSN